MYSITNFLIFMNFGHKNLSVLHFFAKRIKNFDFWNVNRECTPIVKRAVYGLSIAVCPINKY